MDGSEMTSSASVEPSSGRRKRRWLAWLVWTVAILACLGGWIEVLKSATFPRALAEHPVRVDATVTDSYINGLGGDPGFDYEYRAQGHLFAGSGLGEPTRGETVAVEYAADAPAESCFCDAARNAPESLVRAISLAAIFTFPLAFLLLRTVPGLVRTRRSWLVPGHGLRGRAWFLLRVLAALAVGAYLLAEFLAVALER